jgi:hypothetical protein
MAITRDCDLHKQQGETVPATYDAKTKRGPWAYLCDEHMKTDAHPTYLKGATKLADVKGA